MPDDYRSLPSGLKLVIILLLIDVGERSVELFQPLNVAQITLRLIVLSLFLGIAVGLATRRSAARKAFLFLAPIIILTSFLFLVSSYSAIPRPLETNSFIYGLVNLVWLIMWAMAFRYMLGRNIREEFEHET